MASVKILNIKGEETGSLKLNDAVFNSCENLKEGFLDFYERSYQKFVARNQSAHSGFLL